MGGQWLLRIDDIDRERCTSGAAEAILRQLDAHGLFWDEAPRYQTQHLAEYADALAQLRATGHVYACACTRAQLKIESHSGPDGPIYGGRCRVRGLADADHALRLRVGSEQIVFDDGWQGRQQRILDREVGDFVIRRRDTAPAYHLACAVDESAQGITEVVRGADLLGSTFMQLHVMDLLGLQRPRYRHLPVLTQADGLKLSKQNHAAPIEAAQAVANLWLCLRALGQRPPEELRAASIAEILAWACRHWSAAPVPTQPRIKVEQIG